MTLAFDMDGVICDILTPWLAWMNETFEDTLTYEDLKGYRVIEQAKAGKRATEFLYMPGIYDMIEPFPGMLELLETLVNEGRRVIIATKCSHNPTMMGGKMDWFRRHAPFLKKKDIVFTQDKSLINAQVLIDDDPENLEHFPGERIMRVHGYNTLYREVSRPGFWRAHNAREIEKVLRTLILKEAS